MAWLDIWKLGEARHNIFWLEGSSTYYWYAVFREHRRVKYDDKMLTHVNNVNSVDDVNVLNNVINKLF